MKAGRIMVAMLVASALLLTAATAMAGDFEWTRDLSVRAQADPDGFRVRLATRFKIGDADVKVVLGNVREPADAYMICRLGELSGRSHDDVLKRYKADKGKGWGVMAKNLGIKPGSAEFQALKRGSDFDDFGRHGGGHDDHKDKGGKGKEQEKKKGKK